MDSPTRPHCVRLGVRASTRRWRGMGLGAVLLLAASWLALGPVAVASGASNAGKEARAPVGRAADSVLLSDGFSGPDRLLTNEFAYWNPDRPGAVQHSVWEMTSGSLFVRNG